MKGWKQGNWIHLPANVDPRPNHTNDNYLDYFVGDYNGAVAADRDDNADETQNHCASGHTV